MTAPLAPRLDTRQIATLARDMYALDVVDVRPLGGETASNAQLLLRDGSPRMFKAVEARDLVHASHLHETMSWRASLARRAAAEGIPAATAHPGPDGAEISRVDDDGRRLLVSVSSWMPGVPLASAELAPSAATRSRRELGTNAARMLAALAGHPSPAEPIEHEWAFESMAVTINAALDEEETGARIGPVDRQAIDVIVERFAHVAPVVRELPRGLTHHDLNDFNVLVDPTSGALTGVVDFDDARTAPHVAEVAIAGAYAMLGQTRPARALRDVVAGASTIRPLSAEETSVLLVGAATRLCLNAVLWTARSGAHNATYGAARMARTWPVIRQLAASAWAPIEDGLASVASGSSTMTSWESIR
ncbi:phosphotransferase [Saccharopolyspora sp. NPDC050389]|uniref:phosphotransferase n=1 Tax=Saccharopolyspora sp. NPDC050389 TaxID=3155516 RepID=UPI0033FEADB4